jgi:hypothetical protein
VLPYRDLVKAFGPPDGKGDGYKTTTSWQIVDIADRESVSNFEIYDYKATDAYSDNLPTLHEFRALPKYKWHIAGESSANLKHLAKFLSQKLKKPVRITK